MKRLLRGLLGGEEETAPAPEALEAQREAQNLRLELAEKEAQIERLRQEVERLRSRQQTLAQEGAQTQMEKLFSDAAAPVVQLVTQADLEKQGKAVQARDVLTVARRLVRALERHGLTLEGEPGQQVAFDPERHQSMNAGVNPNPGEMVTVRFVGASYQGKIRYKAIVA